MAETQTRAAKPWVTNNNNNNNFIYPFVVVIPRMAPATCIYFEFSYVIGQSNYFGFGFISEYRFNHIIIMFS